MKVLAILAAIIFFVLTALAMFVPLPDNKVKSAISINTSDAYREAQQEYNSQGQKTPPNYQKIVAFLAIFVIFMGLFVYSGRRSLI